ncbi:hypothetical protein M405DRAFT_832110 [Rhizopogon salebrosus TDB-379]|nr:hypothetical protein M405DRAFT_832110 [Rhizopogon salebrosus TDB-379]
MIPNSVSALKARRRAKTPELPLELWLVIFDHATYVPGIFIPEIYRYSDMLGYSFNRYHSPLIRRALMTKRSLVRVCKQWWHLATPFLYRSIFIGRGRCLSSLASTLALSASGKGVVPGEQPLGSYTERLDIAIRDHRHAHRDEDLELLAEVIRHLRNLAVVSVDVIASQYFSSEMPDTVMDALTSVSPSLKIIDWAAPRLLPRARSLKNLVTATQLHILHYPYPLTGPPDPVDDCALSSCTTLTVTADHMFDQMPSTQLPALRELRHSAQASHLGQFLEKHGKNLTSVQLSWFTLVYGFSDEIDLLAMHCPNLRRLTVTLDSWRLLDAEIFELTPMEYLGLDCWENQSSTKTYKIVFATLARLKAIKPTLRIIRFVNYLNANELWNNHRKALRPALELFGKSNVRLEDHEGRLFSDRLRYQM